MVIPPFLIRTIPEKPTDDMERLWEKACALHPDWTCVAYQDPIDRDDFPLTSPHWDRCTSGAQLAGLVRLEALARHGGVYIDSDVEMIRPLDPLLSCAAFAAWEDENVTPDAVIGATPNHPAIAACLDLAIERLNSSSSDWRTGNGAWATGPGVTTTIFPGRNDVLLLPPGSFYNVHYSVKGNADWRAAAAPPWVFGLHRWHASWLPEGA